MFSFLSAQVDPEPHDLPLAVAGPRAQAERVAAGLERSSPGAFDVRVLADEATARETVLERDAYGSLALGPGPPLVYVAGANGPVATETARSALTAAAQEVGGSAQVRDLQPLQDGDPRGLAINFLVLPLIIVGIISAAILRQRAPELSAPAQLALLGAFAVAGGLLSMLLAGPAVDTLPGPFLAQAAVVALTTFAIAAFTTALFDLLGPAATGLAFLIFLIVGNIGSGASSATEFLPAFWRVLGPYLPPGGAATALRNVAYFDGVELLRPMLVLGAWAVAGVVLTLLIARRPGRLPRTEAASG